MSDNSIHDTDCDAWNPGLSSTIPASLMPLVTLFRAENAFLGYEEARELSDFCGLKPIEVIALRPERLLIHELLIRVSANLTVPDGPNYEDLGINLRSMVQTIYENDIQPAMPELVDTYEDCKNAAKEFIDDQLSGQVFNKKTITTTEQKTWWQRLTNTRSAAKNTPSTEPPEILALQYWNNLQTPDPLQKSCIKALASVAGAIIGHRGKLLPDPDLISTLATNQVCNQYGSALLGEMIEPLIENAAARESFRYLPVQNSPVIMNVKGASASGKSTIRPQQTELAKRLDIPWQDFALISPDYWRKHLLDYDSLGKDYKYAAMLTGQELEIIDKKLDRYMAEKAAAGRMSHLLIDRFRFDSFTVDSGGSSDSRLLSRFGDRIFMFFVVTPPAETVVRAWSRGASTGRFKAVDDLLYHNVEAYTGMPALFFSWILSDEKEVHIEFLDNDVPKGERPKTAAYGWNKTLTVLDVALMFDIDRFRKVNIEAKSAEEILSREESKLLANAEFLMRCIKEIDEVTFADQQSTLAYARLSKGKLLSYDSEYLLNLPEHSAERQILAHFGFDPGNEQQTNTIPKINVAEEKNFTLGRWGPPA